MQNLRHGKRRSPRSSKTKKREDAKMDMTPMIDVTFLLLIFFLCLEFKSLEGKLSSNLPKDRGPAKTSFEPIEKIDLRIVNTNFGDEVSDPRDPRRVELVGHSNRYYLGRKSVDNLYALESELRKAAAVEIRDPQTGRRAPRPITIKTGPGVCYKDVTEVLDLARDARFDTITFGGAEGTRRRR